MSYPPLFVYRAIRSRSWIGEQRIVNSDAFRLRPNEAGISVNSTRQDAVKDLKKTYGACRVPTAIFESLGLTLVQIEGTKYEIQGFPPPELRDVVRTDELASLLSDAAELVDD